MTSSSDPIRDTATLVDALSSSFTAHKLVRVGSRTAYVLTNEIYVATCLSTAHPQYHQPLFHWTYP